ncbi:hypothetical protein [Phytobacter sp. SCO41]|uniref:hypothetical protein n=1 Tax=Phytobacter sp. SCO41 TaxID=1756993 RepID=UPI001CC3EFEC|nr:hypothetical protein [Phytobacter sp. SCO41]
MSNDRETLEKILGGKIEQSNTRNIPGVTIVDGQQVVYFSDDGKNKPRKQFNNITCFSESPNAVRGGVNDRGCKVTPPSGPIFTRFPNMVILTVGEKILRQGPLVLVYYLCGHAHFFESRVLTWRAKYIFSTPPGT